ASKLERSLEEIDYGIESTLLVIGGAPALPPSVGLVRHSLSELPEEPGLADARLAAQQSHLSETVLDLLPTVEQESYLLVSSHESREPGARSLGARRALPFMEDAVRPKRRRDPFGPVETEITADEPLLN